MVTFVPPDSGPLLGDRPVTVGVYKTDAEKERLNRESKLEGEEQEQTERKKQESQTKRWIFSRLTGTTSLWYLLKPSRIITEPQQITVIHIARPMAVECSAGGCKEDKTRSS